MPAFKEEPEDSVTVRCLFSHSGSICAYRDSICFWSRYKKYATSGADGVPTLWKRPAVAFLNSANCLASMALEYRSLSNPNTRSRSKIINAMAMKRMREAYIENRLEKRFQNSAAPIATSINRIQTRLDLGYLSIGAWSPCQNTVEPCLGIAKSTA